MAPKAKGKGKKKGKKDESLEPEHHKTWERAVESQTWAHDPALLPDAQTWPTWGALRERVLQSCKHIRCERSASVRDAFAAELVTLSPGELVNLSLAGCPNLHRVVLSPSSSCPKLSLLNLSGCTSLRYVLVQSASLQTLDLSNCPELTKVIIHAPNATTLIFDSCPVLASVQIWSDQLTSLKFPGCTSIASLDVRCDALQRSDIEHPPLVPSARPQRPEHAPLRDIVTSRFKAAEAIDTARKDANLRLACNPARVPEVYRGVGASRMGCA